MASNLDFSGVFQSKMTLSELIVPDLNGSQTIDETAQSSALVSAGVSNVDVKPIEEEEHEETVEQRTSIKNSAESLGETPAEIPQVGKPQVVVRIRPPAQNVIDPVPVFEVDQGAKTVQIRVEREERRNQGPIKHPPTFIYFQADEIMEESDQESTFTTVAGDVVEKAMMGIPGMIVAIGPEMSGKSFTLFGLSGRYQNRGITMRAIEKMFDIKDRKQGEVDFKFGMSIVEVRRERIRDLLTLSSNEINEIGERGPKGMYIEEVDCIEHALGLMLRALIGQKLIHPESYERYHTIVYLEIVAVNPVASELVQYQSRITLVEIASAPYKNDISITPTNSRISLLCGPNEPMCLPPPSFKTDNKLSKLLKAPVFPPRKCCNPGQTQGPLAESIAVRRDVFSLEQIFLRANEMNRIRKYFAKMENLGLSMIASEKRKLASGNNFRQNKLAHCLKDIMDTNTEIRIVLHVRPEKLYLKSSLEAMRFAERARLVPTNLETDNKGKPSRTEEQILQEVIQDIAPELIHPVNMEALTSEKMKVIQAQAVKYFQNNIEDMKECSKDKVKTMFENFRVLLNFLCELELNVSLQKAEEEMRHEFEKMNAHNAGGNLAIQGHHQRKSDERRGSTGGRHTYEADDEEQIEKIISKKSTKKLKKDKERKKRKDRQNQQTKRTSSNEMKADDAKLQEVSKRGSTMDAMAGPEDGTDNELGVPRSSQTGDDDKPLSIKGETEVANTSPPDTTEQLQQPSVPPSTTEVDIPSSRPSAPSVSGSNNKEESIDLQSGTIVSEIPISAEENIEESVGDVENIQSTLNSKTSAAGDMLQPQPRKSTVFVAEDFSVHRFPASHHESEKKLITDDERKELAAQQEQQIAENFEEMKKIARRQAIHLLRSGIRRPQWMSQF